MNCNKDNQLNSISRCSFNYQDASQTLQVFEVLACFNGFVKDGQCVSNCGYGYFEETENLDHQLGSYERGIKSLPDAISRAYEIGGIYTSSKIKIILKSKPDLNHAILRQVSDFYMPSLYDQYSQSTQITIDTEDGLPQQVFYKMRDKWRFIVGGGLELRNLIFDAIDSQLTPKEDINKCLQNGLINCCGTEGCLEKKYFLIEINGSNGHLILDQVTFDNINSCGSIIGNKKPIINVQSNNNETPFGIGSLKKQLGTLFINQEIQYKNYGSIINLENFQGDVIIQDSQFQYNQVKYQNCDIAKEILNNNLNYQKDEYQSLGEKNRLKIHSLISVTKHSHNVDLINNAFNQNSGTKGIIILDVNKQNQNRILIAGNSFTSNFGYFESNVINIRHRVEQLKNTELLQGDLDEDSFCSGFHLIKNKFKYNMGCPLYSGALVKYECLQNDQQSPFPNDKMASLEAQAYYEDQFNLDEIQFDWIKINEFQFAFGQESYNIDLNINSLRLNSYIQNYVSGGSGIIDIIGSFRTRILDEQLLNNGESCQETLNYGYYHPIGTEQINGSYLSFTQLVNDFLVNYKVQAKLISYFENGLDIQDVVYAQTSGDFYQSLLLDLNDNYAFQLPQNLRIRNIRINNFECILCKQAIFNIKADNLAIDNVELNMIGQMNLQYQQSEYGQDSHFFNITIKDIIGSSMANPQLMMTNIIGLMISSNKLSMKLIKVQRDNLNSQNQQIETFIKFKNISLEQIHLYNGTNLIQFDAPNTQVFIDDILLSFIEINEGAFKTAFIEILSLKSLHIQNLNSFNIAHNLNKDIENAGTLIFGDQLQNDFSLTVKDSNIKLIEEVPIEPQVYLYPLFFLTSLNNTISVNLLNSSFQNQNGGSIYCKNCLIKQFELNRFTNIMAQNGGAIYIDNSVIDTIEFIDNELSNSLGVEKGGFIYINDSQQTEGQIGLNLKSRVVIRSEILDVMHFELLGGYFGSLLYYESFRSLDFLLENVQIFKNNEQTYEEGYVLFSNQYRQIEPEQGVIQQINTQQNLNLNFTMKNVNSGGYGYIKQGGVVKVKNKIDNFLIQIIDSQIDALYTPYDDNLIKINGTGIFCHAYYSILVLIENSSISSVGNNIGAGGFMYLEASIIRVNIKASQFKSIRSRFEGGFAMIVSSIDSQIEINNCYFYFSGQNSIAGGLFFIQGSVAQFVVKNQTALFQINQQNGTLDNGNGGLLYLNGKIQLIEFDNLTIQNSIGGLFYLQNGRGQIYSEKNTFKGIITTQPVRNASLMIASNTANVLVMNSKFWYCDAFDHAGLIMANGTGIQQIKFINSNFKLIYADQNGALIYADNEDVEVILENNNFTQILSQEGGLFYVLKAKSVQISNNIITQLLSTSEGGSLIYLQNAASVISSNNTFDSWHIAEKGSIYQLYDSQYF
ncbi:UNKNOWN [Stylonychia lemnae]|uniref:Pectin lyase fold/virulence factor n=1 Tax=Stylonychia lemnae TaxID=5949 RepID=A0A077ZSK1_STYLE|nr:UNKNOWN [Stylonychia lemnae]|eukprot:CDW72858.1 UNKNOWN [Stylonychia lemnae]